MQDSNGHVGDIGRTSSDVCRPEDDSTRIQSHPPEQEDHCCRPGPTGDSGPQDIQGKLSGSYFIYEREKYYNNLISPCP